MFYSYCAPLRTGVRFCLVGPRGELMAGCDMTDAVWAGVNRDNLPWGQLAWPVPESAGAVTLLDANRTVEDDMWIWHCEAPGWQQARYSGLSGQGANRCALVACSVAWHMPHADRPTDEYAQRWGRVGEGATEKFEVLVGIKPLNRVYVLTYPMARPNWVPNGTYCRPYTSLEQATEMTHNVIDRCTEFIGILAPGTVQTMAFRAINPQTRRWQFRLTPWASQYLPFEGRHTARVRNAAAQATDLPTRDLLNAISSTSLAIAAVVKAASELRRRNDPIFVDPALDERRQTLSRLELQLGVVLAEFSKQLPNVVERVLPVDPVLSLEDTPVFPPRSDALPQPSVVGSDQG